MSRRTCYWRKRLRQCGGNADRLRGMMPAALVTGDGKWLSGGVRGTTVTRPMSLDKESAIVARAKEARKGKR